MYLRKSVNTPQQALARADLEMNRYDNQMLLHCPIRGQLNAKAVAKDGLTITEEARRIDFLHFYLTGNTHQKTLL